jgi:outer membrane immunogenic protein
MKRILVAGIVLAAFSSAPTLAADMPIKAPVYKVAAPFSWEGLYAGVHAGYGWDNYKIVDAGTFPVQTATLHPSGGLGGFQIGYNGYLAPSWVLGTEIDFSFADIKANGITSPSVLSVTTKTDFLGTARARLGYAMDRTLLYVTGGMAWAHVKANEATLFFAPDAYHVGWTLGGGLEYAFDPRWSMKVEYLYADLGSYNNAVGGFPRSTELTLSTVKAGLNYRFGDPAPSASAMPVKARPVAWSWNGSYIGVNAGYARGDFHGIDPVFGGSAANLKPSGWFGGLQTGYNWQFAPNWLFGVETDNSFADFKQSGFTTGVVVVAANVKIDGFDTLRARLGYVMDRSLVYGTGGFALAHVKFNQTGVSTWKDYQGGWTIGAGWEYAIDAKWSAKIEYLYADFGRSSDVVFAAPRSTTLTINTVKAGLNYKFDLGELLRGH